MSLNDGITKLFDSGSLGVTFRPGPNRTCILTTEQRIQNANGNTRVAHEIAGESPVDCIAKTLALAEHCAEMESKIIKVNTN